MAFQEFSREKEDDDPDKSLYVNPTFFRWIFAFWELAFILLGLFILIAPFTFSNKLEWAIMVWILGCGSGFFWLRKRSYRIV